jgi:hypothetical protein
MIHLSMAVMMVQETQQQNFSLTLPSCFSEAGKDPFKKGYKVPIDCRVHQNSSIFFDLQTEAEPVIET